MTACLYNTNARWIEFLRGNGIRNDVNFWRQDRRVLHLPPGSYFYFKEHGAPRVVGRGLFRESINLTAGDAWARFGRRNGYATKEAFYAAMPEVMDVGAITDESPVGCLILDGLEWLDAPVTLPTDFFRQGIMGPKFFEDEAIAFLAAAFPEESMAGAALPPIVLVEAEATIGGEYDDWDDLTGEQYHYPNLYRDRIVEGRRFIYYRGVRRRGGARGPAEYFGHGTIGAVRRDPATVAEPRAADKAWFCAIEDYVEFPTPVASVRDGQYFEPITHARGWQVGVREISEEIYARILAAAGLPARPGTPLAAREGPAEVEAIVLREAVNLLRTRPARNAVRAVSPWHIRFVGPGGHQRLDAEQNDSSSNGSKNTSGMPAGCRRMAKCPATTSNTSLIGIVHAVEVKGTTGSYFPASN